MNNILPKIEPRFDEINWLRTLGCVAFYDLIRDRGNKVFNLMNYTPLFTNLLLNPTMNIDSNSDGKADNWTYAVGAGITPSIPSIANGYQVFGISASTTTNWVDFYQEIALSPNEVVSTSFEAYIQGNVIGRLQVEFYKGTTYITHSMVEITNTSVATITLNNQSNTDVTLTKVRIYVRVSPNTIGDIGTIYVKNAKLVKAATVIPGVSTGIVSGTISIPNGRRFDGVDDKITIADNEALRLQGSHSIECFIRYRENSTTYPGVLRNGNGNGNSGNGSYLLFIDKSVRTMVYKRNNFSLSHTGGIATSVMAENKFVHVVFTYDLSSEKWCFYVNGKLVNTGTVSASTLGLNIANNTVSSPNGNIVIGENGNAYLNCDIGKIRMYNKALTLAQVKELYKLENKAT